MKKSEIVEKLTKIVDSHVPIFSWGGADYDETFESLKDILEEIE